MKRLLLFVLSFSSAIWLYGQSTALDFDLADCNGNQHHLLEELDNGYVIILQIIDVKSVASASSVKNLESLISSYKAANPDKIFFYSISADDAVSCAELLNWASANNINHPVFAGGRSQSDYYNVSTTPAVVIIGNSSHSVYYNHSGNGSAQDLIIKASIEEALAEESEKGVSSIIKNSFATVFPNPFSSSLNVRLNQTSSITKVSICDLTGKSLLSKESNSEKLINFSTSALQKGIYFINFYQGDKIAGTFKLVKKQ